MRGIQPDQVSRNTTKLQEKKKKKKVTLLQEHIKRLTDQNRVRRQILVLEHNTQTR